jgi:hypothetical protein
LPITSSLKRFCTISRMERGTLSSALDEDDIEEGRNGGGGEWVAEIGLDWTGLDWSDWTLQCK